MQLEHWTSPVGTVRILTVLDRREARTYATATRIGLPRPAARSRSFGSTPMPDGTSRPWPAERVRWRRAVGRASAGASLVIVADVADCYPSIREPALRMAVRRAGGRADQLELALRDLWSAGVRGLPIGPGASSYLADQVLAIADDRAAAAGVQPIRWVDDVVFAGGRDEVHRAARAWSQTLAELGLRENDAKRRCFFAPSTMPRGITGSHFPRRNLEP